MRHTRVLLADDHRLFLEGLRRLLSDIAGVEVCGTATSTEEAEEQLRRLRPDLLILDIAMPTAGGLSLLMNLRRQGISTPVMFLTMHKAAAMAHRALCAGARGYVLKDEVFPELEQAIERVVADERYVSPAVQALLAQGAPQQLSERESEVLMFIAAGYSSREIAEALRISLRTVQTHREHMMSKLGVHKAADLVRYAVQVGLVDE